MPSPSVCVLRAPGTNCDVETAFAFQMCGARARRVHLLRLLQQPKQLLDYEILCIPGGFSYGDDIGAGVIFAAQLRGNLAELLGEFLTADKLILGICNGFQVLLKSRILPGGQDQWNRDDQQPSAATLTWNDNGKFTARWVRLRTAGSNSLFLRAIEEIDLPIAHAEGKLVVRDDAVLQHWIKNRQVALSYTGSGSAEGDRTSALQPPAIRLPYPDNPNGSMANIAGLSDQTGRVLGLMPHPERYIFGTQHPQWTRRPLPEEGDGLQIFRNAVEYFR